MQTGWKSITVLECLLYVLLAVDKVHLHTELLVEVFGEVLGTVDRTMLAACASEADGEVGEATFHITLYRGVNQFIGMFQKGCYLSVFFQELDYGCIKACKRLITVVLPGLLTARQSNTNPPPLPDVSSGIPFL